MSYALAAGGLWLLFSGARELLSPWIHQHRISESWRPSPRKPRQLHPGETVAWLRIPRLGTAWYVVEGTGSTELRLGPGHMEGTAWPGQTGNCVIAGHRDTQFRALRNIRKGDKILVGTGGGEYRYRVTGTDIVWPDNTRLLAGTPDGVLSLVTCYPFYYLGPAPKRFVVRAELVGTADNRLAVRR